MALSNEQVKSCIRRLLLSRMRILNSHGFYGLLLMRMIYTIDEGIETACTDGVRITFSPAFLQTLSDPELDFVMMHEILHVVLQHVLRGEDRDHERFNIACDIVVNSNILKEQNMDLAGITLRKWGESMHLAPDGKEGYEYTAEQVYDMLAPIPQGARQGPDKATGQGKKESHSKSGGEAAGQARKQGKKDRPRESWDDHSKWGTVENEDALSDVWAQALTEACEAISVREKINGRGLLPLFAQRLLQNLREPQTDWRTILNEFVQEEVCDYSFAPPDRRFGETPFFLPDFNELGKVGDPANILFMIDISASMSDREITAAFSEVKGAIDQFNGSLKGWLGFFDAAIVEPTPFESVDDVLRIKPVGGGGTNFQIIFEYVSQHMEADPTSCIIILTDGGAPFPQEQLANGIPVLWLIDNEKVDPPWGKVARIKVSGTEKAKEASH